MCVAGVVSFQGHDAWRWQRVNFEVRKCRHNSNFFLRTPNSVMSKSHEFLFQFSEGGLLFTITPKSSCSCQTWTYCFRDMSYPVFEFVHFYLCCNYFIQDSFRYLHNTTNCHIWVCSYFISNQNYVFILLKHLI